MRLAREAAAKYCPQLIQQTWLSRFKAAVDRLEIPDIGATFRTLSVDENPLAFGCPRYSPNRNSRVGLSAIRVAREFHSAWENKDPSSSRVLGIKGH